LAATSEGGIFSNHLFLPNGPASSSFELPKVHYKENQPGVIPHPWLMPSIFHGDITAIFSGEDSTILQPWLKEIKWVKYKLNP
jgi:hypothetical protein